MSWIKRVELGRSSLQVVILFVSLSLGLYPCVGHAAPGDLDLAFGFGGIVTTTIGSGSEARAMAIQPDGKIVVAGYSSNGGNYDFAVARYNSDGSPDIFFGGGGKVTTPIGSENDVAHALGIQPDGKIVVAGETLSGGHDYLAVVRYNSDGSLDTSLGNGGKVITPLGSYSSTINALAVQLDGKIVVAGKTYTGASHDFAVVRYNSDGSLDKSFGNDGKVITSIGNNSDLAYALGIQPDWKIVVAGYSYNGSDADFAVVQYNSNGGMDTKFGGGGKVTTPIGSDNDRAHALGIQPDGKIVVAGESHNGSNYDFAVVRYNSNGSLDMSFGKDGKVTTPIGGDNDVAYALGIQSDGRIVVAGKSPLSNGRDNFAVVRYNSAGSLDTSFGNGGKVTTPIGSDNGIAYALGIQSGGKSDGKIVVAGTTTDNKSISKIALARYLATSGGMGGTATGVTRAITGTGGTATGVTRAVTGTTTGGTGTTTGGTATVPGGEPAAPIAGETEVATEGVGVTAGESGAATGGEAGTTAGEASPSALEGGGGCSLLPPLR